MIVRSRVPCLWVDPAPQPERRRRVRYQRATPRGERRAPRPDLTREEKIRLLELLREKHRRQQAKRLAEHREEVEAACKTLYGFVQEFWYVLEPVKPFVGGWAIKAMCEHLEAVTRGDIQFLMINVPPGMMKSLLVSVFWPAWEWGACGRPDLQYLTTSFSDKNVIRDNMKMRRLVKSEKYQALWPIDFRPDADAKTRYENTKNGFREGRAFGSLTGGRANRLIIDDPHSVKGGESDAEREASVTDFREGASDRLNDIARDAIVIIMQRVHMEDVAGTVLDPLLDMGFVVLSLPMEFVPETRCETFLFVDPRTTKDELLFPERFPAKEVARLKRIKGAYAWAGQYQQDPVPRGGGLFERTWFKPLRTIPAGIWKRVRAWDIGATEGGGDPSAGVLAATWDEGEDQKVIFLHSHVGQWGQASLEREMMLTAAMDGEGTYIRLPQDPGAAGKNYVLTLVKKLRGYATTFSPITGDKRTRATALSGAAEAGNVYILIVGDPQRPELDAWVEPFLSQIGMFPLSKHDDQVDAAADAYNELVLGVGLVSSEPIRG